MFLFRSLFTRHSQGYGKELSGYARWVRANEGKNINAILRFINAQESGKLAGYEGDIANLA